MAPLSGALLEGRDLVVSLGSRPVLSGVSLAARPGERWAVLGPNGGGKTTLLRTLAGLVRPDAGGVLLGGLPISRQSRAAIARRLAMVPQRTEVPFDFRLEELVAMGRHPYLRPLAGPGPRDREAVERALLLMDLLPLRRRPASQVSAGELQRAVIARALAQEPRVLLLDEPTAALDLAHQAHLLHLLRRLSRDEGIAAIMVTHDVNLAAQVADRLLLLADGRALAEGPPSEVIAPELLERAYGIRVRIERAGSGAPRVVVGEEEGEEGEEG